MCVVLQEEKDYIEGKIVIEKQAWKTTSQSLFTMFPCRLGKLWTVPLPLFGRVLARNLLERILDFIVISEFTLITALHIQP